MPVVEDFGIPYGGCEAGLLNFFRNSLMEYVLIWYGRFKNFIFQVSPQEIVQGGQIRTGGQRPKETSLSPKNPRSIAIDSFDVCGRALSCWNMQSLSSSSSNTINCKSMSAYTSLVIVVVKKIGPAIQQSAANLWHTTLSLWGDVTQPRGIHAHFLWTTSCNFANLRTRPSAPTLHR